MHKTVNALFDKLLLIALAMSILTLPLVLLTKISVGASQFSVSYVFISIVLGWTAVKAFLHMGGRRNDGIGTAALLPSAFLLMVALYTMINGVEPAFLMSMLLWGTSTFLGLLLDRDLASNIIKQMRAIALFSAVLGVVLYIFNFPLLDLESLGSDSYFVNDWGHYRAASIFLNPNSFAYFLLFAFSSYFFGAERLNGVRLIVLAGGLIVFFLTGSRSSFVAFGVLLIFWAMRAFAPRVRFIAYSFFNLALLSTLTILVIMSEDLINSDIRFEKWAFSVELFLKSQDFWFLGMPATFQIERLGLFFSDNMFLMVLFRMGIPGFLLFSIYYVHILWRAIQALVWGVPEIRPFAAFLLVCSILMFYSNFFYFYPLVLLHGIAAGQVLHARGRISSNLVLIKAAQ